MCYVDDRMWPLLLLPLLLLLLLDVYLICGCHDGK
jgi:hypothetical protein